MEQIKFSQNWNNKLDCNCFTTIRLFSKKYIKNKTFEIVLKDKVLFQAESVEVYKISIDKLNDYICFLDTGYSKEETIEIFKKMYSSVDFSTQMLALILLKKV